MLGFDVRRLSGFYEPPLSLSLSRLFTEAFERVPTLFGAGESHFPFTVNKAILYLSFSMTFLKCTDGYSGCDVGRGLLLLAK